MRLPRSAFGASCGAAIAAWYSVAPETAPSACDAAPAPPRMVPPVPPQAAAVSLAELRRWLERRGADVSATEFRAAPDADAGRFGLFANATAGRRTTRGVFGRLKSLVGLDRGDAVLATFPCGSAITAASAVAAPAQGPLLAELLDAGVLDDRTAVMLHLAVERVRGKASPLRPWIELLPTTFDTPLFWDDEELGWLRGTALHTATTLKKRALEATWRRLEPVAQQLALAEGLDRRPSLDDFLWAYSIFWSRAISMPLGPATVVEGLVPGLDFANHADASRCRWTMAASTKAASSHGSLKPGPEVRLVCPRGCRLRPGAEVTINYGDKSNEELLYLYGFAEEGNPHDVLMVACPLPPPREWDPVLQARVELLRARGLAPQVFLPADHLAEAAGLRRSRGRKRGRRAGDGLIADSENPVAALDLPPGVMETLEVFVMEKKDVMAELEGAGAAGGATAARPAAATGLSEVEACGLRLALLTTLVRLLELKMGELEGREGGTGPPEGDERLLAAPAAAGLPCRQRAAVTYRLGQKRLARQYLLYTNALLLQEMRHLKALEL